jgi:hypothetical protein
MGRKCKDVSLYKHTIVNKPTNMGFVYFGAGGGGGGGENCEDDQYLKVVLEQFAIPLSQGLYADVDPERLATQLVVYFNAKKDKCISYELALHIVIASTGAKMLFYDNNLLEMDIVKNKAKIDELYTQIHDLQQQINGTRGLRSGMNIGSSASVASYNILNFIVTVNPLMAWYYHLYGYNPTGAVDPDKLVAVRNMVLAYGVAIDPVTGLSGAATKLRERIAAEG